MKGLWLEGDRLELRANIPQPQPLENEALVRVLRAGICNTDLELIRGYYPYTGILGHEFVGVVEEGAETLQGRRVVGEINAACGQCSLCRRGIPTHCENRSVLGIVNRNGAFADYLALPAVNLHPVPDRVSTDAATFVEPLAAALEIQEQVRVKEGDRVLVVGDGKLGQLVAQTLALTGCDLLVVGRHEEKLANLGDRGIKTGLLEAIAWRSFDLAVECTGNPEGFDVARRALRPRGILVLKSTYADRLTLDASVLVVDEITLIGSRCGPFAKALKLLEQEKVDVTSLIQARYPLEKGVEAIDRAKQRGVLKVLLEIS
ncbi:MDR/zinc-dependent alcohol dehydrogenase-like family protein [Spirulina sp. 06S082]|uniref:MDR/zinc-dependent alcohol dehydrogenase-like family protein n=1 Tax=Spirulina sp. 06S082 TaxID=3110248 RepID=UPI002B1F0E4D|nr:alcohol dehydrogenase catalytic domain-containing protein [Spirulina sp. 06S082]MEA5467867.1 alcohol dehydrogenase catalytic domain-containing protein [Spirulina sp. 06S082]